MSVYNYYTTDLQLKAALESVRNIQLGQGGGQLSVVHSQCCGRPRYPSLALGRGVIIIITVLDPLFLFHLLLTADAAAAPRDDDDTVSPSSFLGDQGRISGVCRSHWGITW